MTSSRLDDKYLPCFKIIPGRHTGNTDIHFKTTYLQHIDNENRLLTTITCPLPHVQCQLYSITCILLRAHYHLTTITCPLSPAHFHLSTINCPVSPVHSHLYELPDVPLHARLGPHVADDDVGALGQTGGELAAVVCDVPEHVRRVDHLQELPDTGASFQTARVAGAEGNNAGAPVSRLS